MAVAGINNVSVLESSYFGNQEKPVTRTSFIRKLWRDLDDETKNKQTKTKQTNVNDNITGGRCSCSSEGGESENMSTITSEAENECPLNQISGLQPSPAIGTADKERVRRVFREWGSKNINSNERALNVSHTSNNDNNCSRARLVCDTESLRVRTVRQWLESNTQQAETCVSPMEEQDGLGVGQTSVGGRKCLRLLYGRHALLDLLKRFEAERKKEMRSLLESQPVSTFAHRKRIKALLKGRFLLNQRFVQDEKPTSTAARELGHLRQSQTVSDLRKGFLSRVNSQEQAHDGPHSDTASINSMKYQENEVHEDIVNESATFSENDTKNQENLVHEDIVDESDTSSENDTKYLENQLLDDTVNDNESERQQPLPPPPTPQPTEPCQESLELKSRYESNVDELELEVDQAFDHLSASETETDILSWQEEIVEAEDNATLTNIESTQSQNANSVENQDDWMYQENVHNGWYDDDHPVVTTDAFFIHDDDTDNNIRHELQRLTSRRRVSNLLQSGFRVRLNQVLQSYLARQHQASESDDDWMLETEHQEDENDEVDESTELGDSWQHPEVTQQSATDLEIINGLRMDMVMLQERMNSMQSALETCMKMQLELQRSVQQEVSLALNRSSNSGEESLQSCFLCCDSGSDSSPNSRCGHVYVCANCAEKINWSKVKESVRHP
ncbi:uncharacterized protein LOC143599094 isoform X1 [Bidens hawaiensis]|uniref:uncharacterized protein LOC143599094 isoform X1 n=1 Tax=Bidens hawaiensis TaxID=980011 RepID=UPI004049A940